MSADAKTKTGGTRKIPVYCNQCVCGPDLFKVEADSDINSNPRDTKDHPGGVWALPPTFRNGDQDRRKNRTSRGLGPFENLASHDLFSLSVRTRSLQRRLG